MPTLRVELPSSMEQLAPFRASLREWLGEAGFDDDAIHELVLAVDEALTNICEHGYGNADGSIQVVCESFSDRAEVLLRDRAKRFDPTRVPTPELPPRGMGGMGIHFMRTNTDRMGYTVGSDGANELRLVKRRAQPGGGVTDSTGDA